MHMAQLMPLPLIVSCFSKIQIGLPFWYRLTRVVPDNGPLNGMCVCPYAVSSWQLSYLSSNVQMPLTKPKDKGQNHSLTRSIYSNFCF